MSAAESILDAVASEGIDSATYGGKTAFEAFAWLRADAPTGRCNSAASATSLPDITVSYPLRVIVGMPGMGGPKRTPICHRID